MCKPLTHAFSGVRLIWSAGGSQRRLMKAENQSKSGARTMNQWCRGMWTLTEEEGAGTRKRKVHRFKKLCSRIFQPKFPRSRRLVMSGRGVSRRAAFPEPPKRSVGHRNARAMQATNIFFAKRTQIKLRCKRLKMRTLINNLWFSKSPKRTQTNPNRAMLRWLNRRFGPGSSRHHP